MNHHNKNCKTLLKFWKPPLPARICGFIAAIKFEYHFEFILKIWMNLKMNFVKDVRIRHQAHWLQPASPQLVHVSVNLFCGRTEKRSVIRVTSKPHDRISVVQFFHILAWMTENFFNLVQILTFLKIYLNFQFWNQK